MAEKTTEDIVKDIIIEILGTRPEDVKPEADIIEDLGADSLDQVELVIAFEDEFGIEILDEDAEKATKVADIVKYIDEQRSK